MLGRNKEKTPLTDDQFLQKVKDHSTIFAWYHKKEYVEATHKSGGPTLSDAKNQVDLNVTAQLILDVHTPETVNEEREIFAQALRRNASRVEEHGYKKEAKRKRRLADQVMLPASEN